MRRIKSYLAAVMLGLILVAGNMPLAVHAASLSPNAGGTVINDSDVPLAGGEAEDADAEAEAEVVSLEEEEVPLSSMIMGNGCSFMFHLLLLLGGAVVGAVGMKVVDSTGNKKEETADGQKR